MSRRTTTLREAGYVTSDLRAPSRAGRSPYQSEPSQEKAGAYHHWRPTQAKTPIGTGHPFDDSQGELEGAEAPHRSHVSPKGPTPGKPDKAQPGPRDHHAGRPCHPRDEPPTQVSVRKRGLPRHKSVGIPVLEPSCANEWSLAAAHLWRSRPAEPVLRHKSRRPCKSVGPGVAARLTSGGVGATFGGF